MRHHSFLLFAAVVLTFCVAVPVHAQCASSSIPTTIDGNLNNDINDWTIIYEDARSTGCADAAVTALANHLQSQANAGGWTSGFLQGGAESMAYETGLVLAGKGKLTGAIDVLLRDTPYSMSKDTCGFSNTISNGVELWRIGNTCMDDWAIAAEGWAWRAAYMRKTGRAEWRADRANAIFAIGMSFDGNESICVYDTNQPLGSHGPCNALASAIGNAGVVVLPLNHGTENPSYGVGLISSLANAFLALEVAQDPVNIDTDFSMTKASDMRKIMPALFSEGQSSSTTDGTAFTSACFRAQYADGTDPNILTFRNADFTVANRNRSCADTVFAYHPWMFPVREFFTAYGFTIPSGSFDFSGSSFTSNEGTTFSMTNRTEFFGAFRREVYYTFASNWFQYPANRVGMEGPGVYLMSLKTDSGTNYLTAEGNGGSSVVADRTSAGWWETFVLTVMDGSGSLKDGVRVHLHTSDNYFFSALNGGNYSLLADKTSVGAWEIFRAQKVSDARGGNSHGPVISDGDVFALKSESTGTVYYVVAENGGGGTVNVNRTSLGPWESFTFVRKESL